MDNLLATVTVALRNYAQSITALLHGPVVGEPEEQLRTPFTQLMTAVGQAANMPLHVRGELRLPGIGKPDFGLTDIHGLLVGYAELKAPGGGVRRADLDGRSQRQFDRFVTLPNILYCDGNRFALYQGGKLVSHVISLSGDVRTDGASAVGDGDGERLWVILRDYLHWEPQLPPTLTARTLAKLLAPLCRFLRGEFADAMQRPESSVRLVADRLRTLLFPDADDDKVADAYAQTVTFAFLLARADGASLDTIDAPVQDLSAEHLLLGEVLGYFVRQDLLDEVRVGVTTLQRVIGKVEPALLRAAGPGERDDPWLYFYEDFLAEYDRKLRNDAGAYYTPLPVVRCQVRLVDQLLRRELSRPDGFADDGVVTLDPAVGTGTYLLAVIDRAMSAVVGEGEGTRQDAAKGLAQRLHGFELMVGPYAVAQLRATLALTRYGVAPADAAPGIYLTNTLDDPNRTPPQPTLFEKGMSAESQRALKVKGQTPVIVCLGNPPYDRHAPAASADHHPGRWVYAGDDPQRTPQPAGILRDITGPVSDAGHGDDLKNAYNLYVYFWRWAIWKVFEQAPKGKSTAQRPGVVSFITASSYLDGNAFLGLRALMRRECDHIDIIDLGGEGRGTRKEENVFAIQTPVAIAICWRAGKPNREKPAVVRYCRIRGVRTAKLAALDAFDTDKADWQLCASESQAPFKPADERKGYATFVDLLDLFPWQHTGSELKRTWVVHPSSAVLVHRWTGLLGAAIRSAAMVETRDRKVTGRYDDPITHERQVDIASLGTDAPPPPVYTYPFRSFDLQHAFVDGRLADYPRPVLWATQASGRQVYLTGSLVLPLGNGPALTAAANVPDRHYFCGRGGKDVIPLYRDAAATEPNLLPGLTDLWADRLGRAVSPEDVACYVYALLAHGGYTERFWDELNSRQVRVPLTADADLFGRAVAVGRRLLWLHTYGERFVPAGTPAGTTGITGLIKYDAPVPDGPGQYPRDFGWQADTDGPTTGTLWVGPSMAAGGRFHPVPAAVWTYAVSGLEVVKSWLTYRMPHDAPARRGKTYSSPLDKVDPVRWTPVMSSELLTLLRVLDATVAMADEQALLLASVISGPLVTANDLPTVPPGARRPPRSGQNQATLYDEE